MVGAKRPRSSPYETGALMSLSACSSCAHRPRQQRQRHRQRNQHRRPLHPPSVGLNRRYRQRYRNLLPHRPGQLPPRRPLRDRLLKPLRVQRALSPATRLFALTAAHQTSGPTRQAARHAAEKSSQVIFSVLLLPPIGGESRRGWKCRNTIHHRVYLRERGSVEHAFCVW